LSSALVVPSRNGTQFPHFAKIRDGCLLASQRLPGSITRVQGENSPVNLGRIAWLAAVLACLITVLILVLEGYYGYAVVTFAVAVAAGINLF
jgi:hypothetical protein